MSATTPAAIMASGVGRVAGDPDDDVVAIGVIQAADLVEQSGPAMTTVGPTPW